MSQKITDRRPGSYSGSQRSPFSPEQGLINLLRTNRVPVLLAVLCVIVLFFFFSMSSYCYSLPVLVLLLWAFEYLYDDLEKQL